MSKVTVWRETIKLKTNIHLDLTTLTHATQDRQQAEMQTLIDSFRRDVSRTELLKRLEVAEAKAIVKTAQAEEARLTRDAEGKKVERLTEELNEAEGRHNAAAERDKVQVHRCS